jgi:hypothetical protein
MGNRSQGKLKKNIMEYGNINAKDYERKFKLGEPLEGSQTKSLLTARCSYLIMELPLGLSISFRTFATHAYRGLAPRPCTATMLHLISEYKAMQYSI